MVHLNFPTAELTVFMRWNFQIRSTLILIKYMIKLSTVINENCIALSSVISGSRVIIVQFKGSLIARVFAF